MTTLVNDFEVPVCGYNTRGKFLTIIIDRILSYNARLLIQKNIQQLLWVSNCKGCLVDVKFTNELSCVQLDWLWSLAQKQIREKPSKLEKIAILHDNPTSITLLFKEVKSPIKIEFFKDYSSAAVWLQEENSHG